MTTIARFEDLEIWINARRLCTRIRTITRSASFKEDFSLKNQILGSSGSVMDNIAEGFERDGNKEFVNFLYIAKASLGETRSQIHRSFDAEYINNITYEDLLKDCFNLSGQISHLIGYLSKSEFKGTKRK